MPRNTDKRPLPQQHKRSHHNDYHRRGIYMITLCTDGRLPLLGTLIGNTPETATISPSLLGLQVLQCWNNIPSIQKQLAQKKTERTGVLCQRDISLIACQLMPDHFHGIIFVHTEMDVSIGDVVRGFMVGCTKAYNVQNSVEERSHISLKPFWEKGFHDRILLHAGQLQNMIEYVRDNPRRVWLKKMRPEYFAVQHNVHWNDHCFSAVGNILLLDNLLCAVHVRSRFSEEDARNYMNDCIVTARKGTVLIGAFISQKEKQVLEVALKEGLPVIILLPHGLSEFYKPVGMFMEACAQGKMLFLTDASDEESTRKRISREECQRLNAIAEEMMEWAMANKEE
ncbi:MAG: transposase [Bacteroidales bacterium]|nr:transposase [Bacteroidales bacterium]